MKNIFKLNWQVFLALAILITVASCSSEDPEPVNEEELITTVRVTFTNTQDATDVVTATFTDLDGPGGDDGVAVNPTLSANSAYTATVEFLNEAETPTEDITEEVAEEDDEHQVFFITGSGLNLTYTYDDQDGNGNPLGLTGIATTAAASTGTLQVVLVHEPVKTAAGVSGGDLTNAAGDEDIRVSFSVTIQ